MHVEWKLSLPLQALLLGRNLIISLNLDSLGQQFLRSSSHSDVLQRVLGIINESLPEGTESNLN